MLQIYDNPYEIEIACPPKSTIGDEGGKSRARARAKSKTKIKLKILFY